MLVRKAFEDDMKIMRDAGRMGTIGVDEIADRRLALRVPAKIDDAYIGQARAPAIFA